MLKLLLNEDAKLACVNAASYVACFWMITNENYIHKFKFNVTQSPILRRDCLTGSVRLTHNAAFYLLLIL